MTPQEQVAGAIAFAKSKIGHPYSEVLDGGVGPTYYDCSGLWYEAYLSVGVNIGRDTYEQLATIPYRVGLSESDWEAGDLIYAIPYKGDEHVVGYIGNDQIIQAPHTGAFIYQSSVAAGFPYAPIGARRPCPGGGSPPGAVQPVPVKFPVTAYDSTVAADCPPGAAHYFGYSTGAWLSYAGLAQLYGPSRVSSITVDANAPADMYDCEPGNGTPADCPRYYAGAKANGVKVPIIYCSASWSSAVIAAMNGTADYGSEWLLFSAHVGAGPHICGPSTCGFPQAHGTQWIWHGNPPDGKGNYDESLLGPAFAPIVGAIPTVIPPGGNPPHTPPAKKKVPLMLAQVPFTLHDSNHSFEVDSRGRLLHWRWVTGKTPTVEVVTDQLVPDSQPTSAALDNLLQVWSETASGQRAHSASPWGGPWRTDVYPTPS